MRTFLCVLFIMALHIPGGPVLGIGEEVVDDIIFLLQQPEWDGWSNAPFDERELVDGLKEVYTRAISAEDLNLRPMAVWAMGETGREDFIEVLVSDLEYCLHMHAEHPSNKGYSPSIPCCALGKIACDDSVDALIEIIDNDDKYVRDAIVCALGSMPYAVDMDVSRTRACEALRRRLELEPESWIRENIEGALELIETGHTSNPAFVPMTF